MAYRSTLLSRVDAQRYRRLVALRQKLFLVQVGLSAAFTVLLGAIFIVKITGTEPEEVIRWITGTELEEVITWVPAWILVIFVSVFSVFFF
jgi:hypothetical protein